MNPLVVYDGDCAFCRRIVGRWHARTGERVDYVPFQQHGLLPRLGIPLAHAKQSVQLVMPDGARYQGAEAVFRLMRMAPGLHLVARLGRLPGLRWIAERVYRWVSRNRVLASRIDRAIERVLDRTLGRLLNRRSVHRRYAAPLQRG